MASSVNLSSRLTTTWSNSDDNEEIPKKANDKERNGHRSVTTANEGKKSNLRKTQKQQSHNDSKDKKAQPPEQRTGRTASEGASGKKLPYKQAQNKESSTSQGTSDFQRSVSVSAVVGAKPTENKRLPAVPTGNKTSEKTNKAEGKSKHDYDNVKGAEDKGHKYANVELSEEATKNDSILEPKYDKVDTENTKKNRKENDRKSKGKAKDNDHYYHTLEDSEAVNAEAINDEEYSSPKSKSLVVNKVAVQDKKGKVLSTEENATVKESGGTKSKRAKSYSGKKKSKDKAGRDHEYDEPTHNTLPHRSTLAEDEKESKMQAGKLTLVFDDPMYSASTEMPTSKSVQLVPTKPSSPTHESSEAPVLRNPEKSKKGKDEPKYDKPVEKPSRMTKDDLYSSRLFDDPKYEDTQL